MSHYDIIIQKLDAFIRKYYTNQLLRGVLLFLSAILLYVLLVTIGEYFFYFSIQVKLSILAFLITVGGLALAIWVIVPILKIRKLGKILNHEDAAKIIGDFFPEIDDKLLNVLQLKSKTESTFESKELIAASIDQRASKISILPFSNAVDIKKNKKYLPYLAFPIIAAILIFLLAPKIFTEGGYRLSQPSVFFAKPAPFQFEILNKNFEIIQGQSFTVKAKLKGEKIPDKMYIEIGGQSIEMQADGNNSYSYTLEKVYKTTDFKLGAADYFTPNYTIKVLQKPELQGMQVHLQYPAYTGKQNETIQGLSDISVPAGTTINWELKTTHTDAINIIAGNTNLALKNNNAIYSGALKFVQSIAYSILLSNQQQSKIDTLSYTVQVIEDQFPQVDIQVLKDTTLAQQILISGTAGDDYQISRNMFVYQILNEQQKVIKTNSIALKSGTQVVQFSHYFDIGTLNLSPGQQVNYYVEVWDNDGVNGPKSRRSQVMSWKASSIFEMDKHMAENAERMNSSLSVSAAQAEMLQEDYKDMQKEMMNSNNNNWERNQKMQLMLDKNIQVKQNLEQLKKRFEEQSKQTDAKNFSEDVKEKQEALKEQIDNLKDKQLEEQIKKLQELMNQKNQQNEMQQLKQMEQMNKLFQMDMERLQELMKKLELQMSIENLAKQIDALAAKQDALEKETGNSKKSNEQLAKEQNALKKELENLMKEGAEKITNQNEKQERPENIKDLENVKEDAKDAAEDMKNSSEQMQKNNSSSSKQSQKQAKNKLEEMSKKLNEMSSGMEMEQIDIDIKATRQLLTNLIRFSFDQEKLIERVKQTSPNSPNYNLLTKEQNRLKKNTEAIKDSLYALSKRIFKIAATINKETTDLDNSIEKALRGFESHDYSTILSRQQYAMTASNNLALLLNELLANLMQEQASSAMGSGSGKKGKPQSGQGNSSSSGKMKDIISGQQQMGKGMQELKSGQQSGGQQSGGQQQGESGQGQGQNGKGKGNSGQSDGNAEGDAEKVARLAQQQAMLRKQVQDLVNELNSKGMGGTITKEIRDIQAAMDKMETDLVFRKNTEEMLRKNKEILTKMLEAEKAIQEQEEDNKRSAQAGKDAPRPMPSELSEYLQQQQKMLEQYRKGTPLLKPFYQKMAEEYLKKVLNP